MAYAAAYFWHFDESQWRDLKTIQEMLRHATFKVTADVYTQAITAARREAHNKVVKQFKTVLGKDGGKNGQ